MNVPTIWATVDVYRLCMLSQHPDRRVPPLPLSEAEQLVVCTRTMSLVSALALKLLLATGAPSVRTSTGKGTVPI